jgi:hypothetical protein
MTPPVLYSPHLEQVRPDETETIQGLKDTFDTILETTSADYGHAVRAVHAKGHAILEGTLAIDAGLPPELAQGLFAAAGEHTVYMRFSTNPGDILNDAVSLPRGVAIKVLDVEGERLPGAEGRTQDFIMVNARRFQAKTTSDFLKNLKLLAKTTDRAEWAKVALAKVLTGLNVALSSVGIESASIQSLGGAPQSDPIGESYASLTPYRYGDYVAQFGLKPLAPALKARAGEILDLEGDPDGIRRIVREEMQGIAGEWEFCVQLCRDLDKQPIEDPTVEWKEDDTPWQRVAVLRTAPQDSWDETRVAQVDEAMRFSIWTGLAAHQPLGNINRARREVYQHSADFRARFNGCPLHEPA